MIKKISQLNGYPEASGSFSVEELSSMLIEVSYLKGEGDEQDYYQSYNMNFKEMYDALGVSELCALILSAMNREIEWVSGDFIVGEAGQTVIDRCPDDYNPGDTKFTVYSDTDLQNDFTVHGRTEFHNNVVLKCGDDDKNNKDKPILSVEGRSTFTQLIDGTAYRAQWGDLAEYYSSDCDYAPGTLIKFGGEKEITVAKDSVNGVVTSNPGVILNGKETDCSLGVALVGKVPIRIRGPVRKFDKIVLSRTDPGIGVVYNYSLPYQVIGRALEENLDKEEKLVVCATNFNISQG